MYIGSTQSTYEVTTTARNGKTVLTINLAAANDLTTSGWVGDNGFGTGAPEAFKEADCIIITGIIGTSDAPKIQHFNYTLLNLNGATLAEGVNGQTLWVHNHSAGIILPQGITATQWLQGNSNPFQYRTLFSINGNTVTADISGSTGDAFANIMKYEKEDYHFFGDDTDNSTGCTVLTINQLTKDENNNYTETGVSLTSDIINGINTANSVFTTINVENASASNLSMVITNTHVTTLNLSGLNLSGEVTLDIGGDATNAANMRLQSLNLSNMTVKTVDASQVSTLTNVNLSGVNITSVDFTREGGKYDNLSVTVDNSSLLNAFTPTAETMWPNDEEDHVMKTAVVYSATDMYLHDGKAGVAGDDSDLKNYVFWYQGDNDPTGIATLNAKGSISGILESEAYDHNKTFTKVKIDGYLSKTELVNLGNISATVLDLSDLDLTHEGACSVADLSDQFCKTNWDLNPNVKFVILPEGVTREQILSADKVSGLKNVYSLVSFTHDGDKFDFTAYNRVSGTLAPALVAGGKGVVNQNMKYDSHNTYTPEMTLNRSKSATISGHINAYDLASGQTKLDADGHLMFNKTYADESAGVDDRINVGTVTPYGGLSGNNSGPMRLDLKYAEIDGPQYINDIKVSSLVNVNPGPLTYVIIPETESVKETPSFFITHNNVKEICIPSNIEVIRTHFAPSVDHIWTTGYKVGQAGGDPAGLRYDNGCYNSKADENNPEVSPSYGYTDLSFSASSLYPFGTYTFSSNLKMIETGAFANTNPCVKDVYVLAKKAPECHVDAFNTKMYVGNGGYSPKIENGVITRDSYVNGSQWITMLHYPRECTSPEVQRYTDPTRQYSIASNEVDGKGGVLYYPSQGEFIAAYAQGTTGYLWNAWDRTYEWGMLKSSANITDAWSIANQQKANGYFLANPDLTEYPGDTKYTCTSFYDVTADGRLEQPAGLVPYYDVCWNERVLSDKGDGIQLYPAIGVDNTTTEFRYVVATEQDFANNIKVYTLNSSGGYDEAGSYNAGTTYYKRVQMQQTNVDGSPKFETCPHGSYVQDTRYVEAENGGFVRERTVSGYAQTNKPIEGIDTYYSDDQGAMPVTPKVGNALYYQDGMKNVYSDAVYYPVKVNGQLVTEYYKKNEQNNTYTLSPNMYFSSTKWYNAQEVKEPVLTWSNGQFYDCVDQWYDSNGNKVTIEYTFPPATETWQPRYYKKINEEYVEVNGQAYETGVRYYTLQDAVYKVLGLDKSTGQAVDGVQFYWGQNYRYQSGELTTMKCSNSTDYWLPEVTTYYDAETGGSVYYSGDGSTPWPGGAFNSAYYYVTGKSPKIVTAQNTPYNSTRTYYTNADGTTEATEVTFDQSYYYPVYNDTYREYEATDGDATQYKLETYYREATTADGDAQRYCPVMEDVEFNPVTDKNDYRGWHQFVLNAYAKNTDIPLQPSRSYQTDNDWWTICLPYDLTYNEVMLFYGDVNESGEADASKVPVVCLLSNVVRDPAKKHIRLNFSSNLMEHKATKTGGEWIVSEDEAPNHDVSADADVIIHAGVPYAIKPMFKPNAGRQFDVYGQTSVNADISAGRITATEDKYPGLYKKLKAAENIAGAEFRAMQEDNLYTVPCLIPADQAKADEVVDEPKITYDGVDYKRSNSLDYTFVGALQRNLIPPFSYFMGYKNTSLFVYADYDTQEFEDNKKETTPDYRNTYKWTNNACVICPNLLSSSCKETQKGEYNKYNLMKGSHKGLVTEATSSAPARWEILNKVATIGGMSILTDDRFADTGAPARGIFGLGDEIHYGNDMKYAVVDGVESVETGEEAVSRADRKVYSINGQYMGDSRQSLKKGIYIIGGKKYVVK